MNQGPYNRRSSSRRRSDLMRRQEGNRFNSRNDPNVRDQYEPRGSRFKSSGPSDGGGGGIKINSNSIAILAGVLVIGCLLYTSPSPRDRQKSRMPSSA